MNNINKTYETMVELSKGNHCVGNNGFINNEAVNNMLILEALLLW